MSADPDLVQRINDFLQRKLKHSNRSHVEPREANDWLEREGLLDQDKTRPGRQLRILLRSGLIKYARQGGPGGRWKIYAAKRKLRRKASR